MSIIVSTKPLNIITLDVTALLAFNIIIIITIIKSQIYIALLSNKCSESIRNLEELYSILLWIGHVTYSIAVEM